MKTIFLPLTRYAALVGLSFGLFACSSSIGNSPINGGQNSSFAGTYAGKYNGNDRGTFTLIVAGDGSITGWGESVAIGAFSLLGQVTAQGEVKLAGSSRNATDGAAFNGAMAAGKVVGTWKVETEVRGAFRAAQIDAFDESPPLMVASPKQTASFTY